VVSLAPHLQNIFKIFRQNWSATTARTENCEADLIRKQKQSVAVRREQTPLLPESYVLCERSSGAVRFRVDADSDGSLPIDKIAGLLAVHCLLRGQSPEDYEVMVVTRKSLLHVVAERTQQLLSAGRALGAGVKVSRREQEVLQGIVQNLANKEIAAKLHVSERTVKFHVSSLLAKFGVTGRVELSREVSLGLMPGIAPAGQTQPQTLFGYSVRPREVSVQKVGAPRAFPPAAENQRGRGRVFPMVSNERLAN
jgi:DNA-binding CsgD family transcriptional regulator